jgi:hypothetical protein
MAYNIPTSFIARPSKIYPSRYFWFENLASGNPAADGNLLSIWKWTFQLTRDADASNRCWPRKKLDNCTAILSNTMSGSVVAKQELAFALG